MLCTLERKEKKTEGPCLRWTKEEKAFEILQYAFKSLVHIQFIPWSGIIVNSKRDTDVRVLKVYSQSIHSFRKEWLNERWWLWDGMGISRFQDWWGYWEWGARVGASWNWSSCAIGGVLWCLGLCWLVSLLGFGSVHFPVLWPFSLGAPDASMGLLGFFPHFMLVFWLLGLCYWLRPPWFSRCMWVLSLFGYLNSGNSGWEMRCPHRTVYLIVWSYLCLCFHPWLNVWFYVTSSSNLKVFTGPQFGMKNPSSDIKKYKTASCVLFRRYLRSLIPGRDWLGSCPGLGQLGLHRSVTLSTHKALFVCYIADLCEFALAVVA